jgi:hypothetical protein
MRDTSKIKSDQVESSLRDGELDAVTGGMFNAFANFGDIKGECTDAKQPDQAGMQPSRTYSIGFGGPLT